MITANKGEWSELYVLFKLLGEKKVHAGDGDLNKLKAYYPILNILRNELTKRMNYSLESSMVVVKENDKEVARIASSTFLKEAKELIKTYNMEHMELGHLKYLH